MTGYEHTDADAPAADGGTEPTWDLHAERAVLGGLLSTAKANSPIVDEVMDAMEPTDFYQPRHESIARAIAAVHHRGDPVDPLLVVDELERAGELSKAGGAAEVWSLTDVVRTASAAPHHAGIVHDLAQRRTVANIAHEIAQLGQRGGDLSLGLDAVRGKLDALAMGKRRVVQKVGDTLGATIDSLKQKPHYYASPWESLDQIIGGFAPGGLYVMAARPGGGKTIALLQCAVSLARAGQVAVSSLEMTEQELQLRLIAQFGPLHMSRIRNHALQEADWVKANAARVALAEAPLFVDDTAGVTMAEIRAHARSVARRGNLSGVVVDYLQLIKGEGQSREQEVAGVSKQLKQLAKDLNVPVIAAAQLRRADKRAKTGPGIDDLRESGSIEQDADCVLLLDRDKDRKPHEVQVIVAKNRHGEQGKVTLQWQGQFSRFQDRDWVPTALFDNETEMAG